MKNRVSLILGLALAGCASPPAPTPPLSPTPTPPPPPPIHRAPAIRSPQISPAATPLLSVSRQIAPPPSVKLAWNFELDPLVTSYNIYWGTSSRNYIGVASTTNNFLTVSNLSFSTTYFFACTAVSNGSLESPYSNEVSTNTPSLPIPPGNLSIESLTASTLKGPWIVDTNWPAIIVANPFGNQFFRLNLTLVP